MLGQLSLVAIVVASALSAGLAGTAAWKYQAARYEAEKAELYQSAQAALRQQEKRYAEFIAKANAQAAERQRTIRRDADRARGESVRLRDALTAATASARRSEPTCPATADALADVLGDMDAAGRSMAETCDRIAADRDALIAAWPR